MPMKELLAYCGGSSKASEIRYMIQAYKDMRDIYAPLCEDDTQFDQKKFSGFVELQKKNVVESLQLHGYDKTDFAQWMVDEKFSRLEDVRRLPQILNSKRARQAFLKHDTAAAKKILEAEDITPDSLKNVTYEMLANELSKRMFDITHVEVLKLKTDAEYEEKLNALRKVVETVQSIVLSYLQAGLSDMQKQQLGAYMDATTEVHSALASQDYVNGVVDGIALREKVTAK